MGQRLVTTVDGVTVGVERPAAPRYPEGHLVAVTVAGGWDADGVQADPHERPAADAMVVLRLDLADDRRGALSRDALSSVLAWVEGAPADCALEELIEAPVAHTVLVGWSNGGNLAWATLAEAGLGATLAGVVSWETPPAAQLALVEPGGPDVSSPLYVPGSCALVGERLSCDYPYPHLQRGQRGLYLDLDRDGRHGGPLVALDGDVRAGDYALPALWHPEQRGRVYSPEAEAAATERGLAPDALAADFWASREAAAAVWSVPPLRTVVVGTTLDHVLVSVPDHPHLTGLLQAAQSAGHTVRLGADAAYVETITGEQVVEHDQGWVPGTGEVAELPEEHAGLTAQDLVTAAVLEVGDRAWAGEEAPDLASPLR